jgi:adenylate cyclase
MISTMKDAPAYQITVETAAEPVRALHDGLVLAESAAPLVMHETGLPSFHYFPRADVALDLLQPSAWRTFCPFKGTASYWHLAVPDGLVENAAFSYETPFPEVAAVAGHIAFLDSALDQPLSLAASNVGLSGPLVDWLLQDAWMCESPEALTEEFGKTLIRMGIPLWRLNVGIRTLHPQLASRNYRWLRGEGEAQEYGMPQGMLSQPAYLNSPVRHVSEGLGGVRQRLDLVGETEFRFPVMDDLRARGGTDYVAMPLPFSDGQINTMTLTSDHPQGFSIADLGAIFHCVFGLSRFYETMTLRQNTRTLLTTYLGQRSGTRVLNGETQRGAGEEIRAAIVYCDLRNSTQLAGSLPRGAYLDLLNNYFETVSEPILSRWGEVLKFIGDAVLAIFPVDDDPAKACALARDAALEIVARLAETDDPPLRCAIGVHVGEVTFGNVGAPERLDFTVIGSAANLAARLSEQCKVLDQSLLFSGAVQQALPEGMIPLGQHALRNISETTEIYTSQA